MGTEPRAKTIRQLEDRIISVAAASAEAATRVHKRQDELVKRVNEELPRMQGDVAHLVDVRNRTLKGRLKWLLTGK